MAAYLFVVWILLKRRPGSRKEGVRFSLFIVEFWRERSVSDKWRAEEIKLHTLSVFKATDWLTGERGVNSWWFKNFSNLNRHGLFVWPFWAMGVTGWD